MVARTTDLLQLTRLGHHLQRLTLQPFIRAVNYHGVSARYSDNLEAQLQYYGRHFQPVDYNQLKSFVRGEWKPRGKPGLLITFDDGLRSHATVAAPLLEKYGFKGWFFVPVGLIDVAEAEQRAAARNARIDVASESGDRVFLDWEQVRALARNHVVGCHTRTHCRLSAQIPEDRLWEEIVLSKQELELRVGRTIDVFSWVGGEEESYSNRAAALIRAANYQLGFMTNHCVIPQLANQLQLQRSNIEAHDPLWMVRFQLSGIMDVLYMKKRQRVNRLTS